MNFGIFLKLGSKVQVSKKSGRAVSKLLLIKLLQSLLLLIIKKKYI